MGRDQQRRPQVCPGNGFNPRARMGRDQASRQPHRGVEVSTHAPAWGATMPLSISSMRFRVFQPTRPHGARPFDDAYNELALSFNPRARMGRDRYNNTCSESRTSFNPRARMGRDNSDDRKFVREMSFNPRARMGRDR